MNDCNASKCFYDDRVIVYLQQYNKVFCKIVYVFFSGTTTVGFISDCKYRDD